MLIRSIAVLAAWAAGALLAVATSSGGSTVVATLRGSVGPGFTIKLTKNGTAVKNLRTGTYKITVTDRSDQHNFVLARQGGPQRQVTSVPFVGTKTVTLTLTKGVWRFSCAPHAAVMVGRVAVGNAVLSRASASTTTSITTPTTTVDDHGGHGEDEPGDDRGRNHGQGGGGDD